MSNFTGMSNGQTPENLSLNNSYTASRESIDVNLYNYLQKLSRRWKPALAVFLLTVGSMAALSTLLKKSYQAEGKLLFKQNNTASLTKVGQGVGELKPLLNDQSPLKTEIERMKAEPILVQTIEKLKLKDEEGKALKPEVLNNKLKIEIIGGTDVISVRYQDQDPYTAADVINTLMKLYLDEQVKSTQAETANADSFISNQLPQIEQKLSKAESDLRRFKEANRVVNLAKEKETLVLELGNLNQQIANVAAQYQGTQAQTATLNQQLGLNLNQALAANQLGGTPVVESIFKDLADVETELAQQRQRFRDNHPMIQSLLEKKQDLNQKLQGLITETVGSNTKISEGLLRSDGNKENQLEKYISLEIDRISQQRQLASLYQSQQAYLQRARQLPQIEQQQQDLVRQVEAAEKVYQNLLDSQQELQLLQNQKSGNAQIIELAQLPEEGSSGRLALMVLGVILGLLLSNLSVLLLEMQDRSLKTMSEIKQRFPYKVLGLIPQYSDDEPNGIVVQREPDSFNSELYRMIQANLKILNQDNPPQVILITSSVPGEGKSTVAANLAAAIAQLGRRVLLIDGDLRRATQHHLWSMSNHLGFKDVLTHKTSLQEVVARPLDRLDLLTVGVVPPNPLALLDSKAMNELIVQAKQDYDFVLIDAPPLPITADVLTLSKLVDGLLFVSRPGVVEQESAAFAQEILATVNKRVLGMVINGVKPSEFERYSYHAKYAKGYFSKKKLTSNKERTETEVAAV
ncbi:putative exopolysaccharide biosynthesis protein [Stanieria sp. NIES-3757]|nr:putative exopolysaccharide biosynthesis protein [Stanieria sp. NIES-3757]